MASTPNFNWSTPDNTGLVKNGALDIRTLGNAIDASLVDLKGGTTGQVLTKASNTDMDFSWVADATGIPATIVDAKGDLIAATAADTVSRLAVGTNGQVLTADSTAATGIKWATPSSGMTNPMTTTGDTIYSSSGSTPARLAIGSTGQVLTVSGGVPTWATPSAGSTLVGCSVNATGTQSISSSTWTALTFNSEIYDTDGFHDNATNNTRITIPTGKGGKYLVNATCQWSSASGTGRRMLKMYINGGASDRYFNEIVPAANTYPFNLFVNTMVLSAGDYIEVYVNQSSGGSDSMDKTVAFFNVTYLGA